MLKCIRISPSIGDGCFATVLMVVSLSRLMRFLYLFGIMREWIRLSFAPVSKRLLVVYITTFFGSYDEQDFFLGCW